MDPVGRLKCYKLIHDSVWKESLKIEIREELQIEGYNFGSQDKRHVKDLEIGRVSRKPFNPTPVMAPIKRRRVEETVTSGMLEKEPKTVSCRPISSREQTGRSNNIPVVSTLDKAKTVRVSHQGNRVTGDMHMSRGSLKLKFGIIWKYGDKLTQSMFLQQNAQVLIDSKVLRSAGTGIGDININGGEN